MDNKINLNKSSFEMGILHLCIIFLFLEHNSQEHRQNLLSKLEMTEITFNCFHSNENCS